jgi:cyclohexadieny/prephenate dehydrogenase
METMTMRTLAIVGVGLMGGSIALAAKARGVAGRVLGVDRNDEALEQARLYCGLDECFTNMAPAVRQAQITVFCTPVDQIAEQVAAAAASCDGGLLTDVGSTKATIVRGLEKKLPAGCRFVGSHPLAGSEKSGAAHAHSRLFEGRVVVVTPTEQTAPEPLEEVKKFWQVLGAKVVEMTPEDHDIALAQTSHLPHLLAAALAGGLPAELRPLTATGFRDTTRVAAGEPALWTGVFMHNRGPILKALQALEGELGRFRDALDVGDRVALESLLTNAKRNRDALGS